MPFIIIALLWLTAIIGWVMNIVAVVSSCVSHGPLDGMFIARIVGIPVALLGAILGYV